ncbi:MAG: DNA adenine methylase [Cyanobacteria bacterium REEB65]|nr:DNA adenine methylase [Cyanobacteria bacterium REEB65]
MASAARRVKIRAILPQSVNYIGSKHTLLPAIRNLLADRGIWPPGTFLDAFSGTTIVGQLAKSLGFATISNDLMGFSHILATAFLVNNEPPRFTRLDVGARKVEGFLDRSTVFGLLRDRVDPRCGDFARLIGVLAYLDDLPGRPGAFVEAYCEGGSAGRLYFSRANGERCQAIRDQIAAWQREGAVTALEAAVLIAALLEGLDQVANTASVYAAYLKHLKATARARLTLRVPALLFDDLPHEAHAGDVNELVGTLHDRPLAVAYLDPPYNHRQYNAYYHLLETVALWDLEGFEPRGKAGLRPAHVQDSAYCRRPTVAQALGDLLDHVGAEHVLLSYSSEGLIDQGTMHGLLQARACELVLREVDYRRFKADREGPDRRYAASVVREYLYALRRSRRPALAEPA